MAPHRFATRLSTILQTTALLLLPGVMAPHLLRTGWSQTMAPVYPTYAASGIVNTATEISQPLAPNTIATVYGTNLAYDTVAVATKDLINGTLPTTLDGVTVFVSGLPAHIFYVSPGQINFLVPYELSAGTVNVIVLRQGLAGPSIPVQLNATAPGLFPYNGYVIASHLDGSLVATASPALPGEIIVFYAEGLGRTTPDTTSGRVAPYAASIAAPAQMQVLLAGVACPTANVLYAGLSPGFAGLYQINLKLPATLPSNPEIRILFTPNTGSPQISPPMLLLAVKGNITANFQQPAGFEWQPFALQ